MAADLCHCGRPLSEHGGDEAIGPTKHWPAALVPARQCICPKSNSDCQHPTCPRFPQPGHYHAMVVAVQDLARQSQRDGVLIDPHEVLAIVDDAAS